MEYQQQQRERLHTKSGFQRPNRDRFNRGAPKQAKGHDALLKELQESGALVRVVLIAGGNALVGKIVARDKFTISLLNGHYSDFSEYPEVIFKHSIERFVQVGKAPSVEGQGS